MFGGRFSFTRFSLRDAADVDFKISAFFVENAFGMVSFGSNVQLVENYRERMEATLTGTRGYRLSESYFEEAKSYASLNANYYIMRAFEEFIGADVNVSSDLSLSYMFLENVNAVVYIFKNFITDQSYEESARSEGLMGANFFLYDNYRESAIAIVYAAIIEEDMVLINVSIPPGSELRIDSENYTVTLDGRNIIHLHSGDWIMLDRNTVELIISNGDLGRVSGYALYTERYL